MDPRCTSDVHRKQLFDIFTNANISRETDSKHKMFPPEKKIRKKSCNTTMVVWLYRYKCDTTEVAQLVVCVIDLKTT